MTDSTNPRSTTKIDLGNGHHTDLCTVIDTGNGPTPTWRFHDAHWAEMAERIEPGDRVYLPATGDGIEGGELTNYGPWKMLNAALRVRRIELGVDDYDGTGVLSYEAYDVSNEVNS
jgi:hypothetical protein